MSECPIHRTELTLGRCWMCRGVPPGAASRSEQSAVVCQCCGRGPDECPLVAGASATCAGGDCACFPDPAAEAAQSPQEGAARARLIEEVSAKVHEKWMETKRAHGVNTRKSETGEELMVPYAELSETAKDLDRGSVRATLAVLDSGAEPGRSVSDRPPASESPGPLAALREHRTILLDGVQSHDCAGRGECWCDDAWRVLGIPWGRVDLARAALRESSAERGGEER